MPDLESIEAQAVAHGHVLGVWHDADGGTVNRCTFAKCQAAVVVSEDGAVEGRAVSVACAHDRQAAERMRGGVVGAPRLAPPAPGGATSMAPSPDAVVPRAPAARLVRRPIVMEPEGGFPEREDIEIPPPLDLEPPVVTRKAPPPAPEQAEGRDATAESTRVESGRAPVTTTDRFAGLSLPELIAAGLSVDAIALRTKLTATEVRRAIAKFPCGCGRPGNHMGRCYPRREAQAVERGEPIGTASSSFSPSIVREKQEERPAWPWFETLTAPRPRPHHLSPAQADAVWASFRAGYGIRETGRRCGVNKMTAAAYLDVLEAAEGAQRCRCGAALRHQGPCTARREGFGGTGLPDPPQSSGAIADLTARVEQLEVMVADLCAERDRALAAVQRWMRRAAA